MHAWYGERSRRLGYRRQDIGDFWPQRLLPKIIIKKEK